MKRKQEQRRTSTSTSHNPDVRIADAKARTDWWLVGPTIAAVFVSIAIGAFTIWATGRQLALTRQQIEETRQQILQAQHAEFIDNRPWLDATSAGVSLENKMHLPGLSVTVKNSGKTPALRVKLYMFGGKDVPLDKRWLMDRAEVLSKGSTEGVIAPGVEATLVDLSFNVKGPPKEFRDTIMGYLKGYADGYFRLDGGIAYTDVNGTEGFTQFCFLLLNGEMASRCLADNDMK